MAMHSKLFRYACVSIFCCSRTALSIYFISNFPNPFYYIFGMLLHCAYRLCRSLAACVRVFSWFCFKPALSASTAYFLIEFFVLCWCHKFPEHQLFLKCCFTLFCCDLEGHTTYKYTSNGLGGTVPPTRKCHSRAMALQLCNTDRKNALTYDVDVATSSSLCWRCCGAVGVVKQHWGNGVRIIGEWQSSSVRHHHQQLKEQQWWENANVFLDQIPLLDTRLAGQCEWVKNTENSFWITLEMNSQLSRRYHVV